MHLESTHFPMTALDESLLIQGGVLRPNPNLNEEPPLSSEAVELFVLICLAGEEGAAIRRLPAHLKSKWEEYSLELEIHNLISRERITASHVTHLALTWQGREAMEKEKSAHQIGFSKKISRPRKKFN